MLKLEAGSKKNSPETLTVQVDQNTWIPGIIDTRNAISLRSLNILTASNTKLSTLHVQLCGRRS